MAKRFIDYAFKSYVLREHNDLLQKAKQSKKLDYAITQYHENGVVMPILSRSRDEIQTSIDLVTTCIKNGVEREYWECLKINNASYQRTKRLRDKIETMLLNGSCIFLTLTFNDDTLNSTTEKQRRVAVSRYLKQYKTMYVANIDFGSENHREHYHAIINTNKVDYSSWRYGSINGERIRNRNIDCDRQKLAKYICKLSNHAIKETTRRCSLLYSR